VLLKITDMLKIFQFIILALPLTCFAQTKKTSIEDSLRTELYRAKVIGEVNQKEARRLEYLLAALLAAKEMALRSEDQKDSIFQALLAVQAYNFNKNHKGNPGDIEIYNALYKALLRFNDPVTKTLPSKIDSAENEPRMKTEMMANKLCSKIKRNMTEKEWEKFCKYLMMERTCPTQNRK
jgi:hypothetical protein